MLVRLKSDLNRQTECYSCPRVYSKFTINSPVTGNINIQTDVYNNTT